MDKLWAPWRMEYIRTKNETGCIFCNKKNSEDDENNLVLYRGNECFILMNLYPYSNGHIMISPYLHSSETSDLSSKCNEEIMRFANKAMNILSSTMNAEGFNFGANIGKAGGAGIADHLHYHVIPRWSGDTNFMPVIGNTKVMVEGLTETWMSLKSKFGSLKDN